MKISVLGSIIDTKNIYEITPIWTQFNSTYENVPLIGNVGFTIYSFNDIHFDICLECEDFTDVKAGEIRLAKITKLRDEIIKYWSDNQSEIPKIEFE